MAKNKIIKYKKTRGVKVRNLGDSIVLIKKENNKLYYSILNKSAAFMWKRVFKLNEECICKEIIKKFDGISVKKAREELRKFINKLINEGFITEG